MKKNKTSNGGLLICYLGVLLLIASCSSGDSNSSWSPKPGSYGDKNFLAVVADQELWEGAVGDTFQYYFSSAYPILPQPEPILDIKHFTPSDFLSEPPRKELRSILFLGDLSDEDSRTTKWIKEDIGSEKLRRASEDENYNTTLGYDKWATDQTLIYLFGKDSKTLAKNIKGRFPAIYKKIHAKDKELIGAHTYPMNQLNPVLSNSIKRNMGVSIKLPGDYYLAVNDSINNSMWIRRETFDQSSNIIFHRLKYDDKSIFTKEGIKTIRDTIGKRYISTHLEDTYMRTNDVDLPMVVSTTEINGNYAFEARGIWDIVNDFMGGPFISYLILKPDTDEVIFVDGFVHAPGKRKRSPMQQMEHVLSTIKFEGD